jgi:hypothetical protein
MMERFEHPELRIHERYACSVAVAIGGSAVLGAGASIFGSSEQSSAETNATSQANALQEQEFNTTQANEAPYLAAGKTALNTITQDQANGTGFAAAWDPSNLSQTPGYQFQLQQGNQAIQRSAAAQGGLLSGAAGKAMDQYSQGLAGTTYQNQLTDYLAQSNQQYNQLAGVAGLGQSATQSANTTGTSAINSIGQNTIAGATGAANASASGLVGASNAFSSGAGNLASYYQNQSNQQNLYSLMSAGQGYGTVPSAGMNMYDNP